MPAYQFESATFLSACGLFSLLVYFLSLPKEGKVKLPTYNVEESDEEIDIEGEETGTFDVTKPEDFLDGDPIDPDRFWARMHTRKLILSIILMIILSIQIVALGQSVVWDASAKSIATRALHVAFTLYVLTLSCFSIGFNDVYYHWLATTHLSALIMLATTVLGTAAILPSDGSARTSFSALWYIALALYVATAVVSLGIKRGPELHFPAECIYSNKVIANTTTFAKDNVCGIRDASIWDILFFSYATKVIMLGYTAASVEIGDLPIVPANMRATTNFSRMKAATKSIGLRGWWRPNRDSGWHVAYRLMRVNVAAFTIQILLAIITACLFYAPALFLQRLVRYLEIDFERKATGWGWVYCVGLFFASALSYLVTNQLWSISIMTLQVRMRIQLNTVLFAKTLVRKDVASTAASEPNTEDDRGFAKCTETKAKDQNKDNEGDFSSKAQIITLMTTDVDRISEFPTHLFSLVDSPIEIVIGSIFLYKLLGLSCFVGLAVACLFLPMNQYAGKIILRAQENLMKSRDERIALMNEVLGAIRMLKFMAWERSFEKRVLEIRERELKYQRLNYAIRTLFTVIWNASPLFAILVSFWHFTIISQQTLTPSIAFTSIAIFTELKFALNNLPDTFINMLQCFVSLRRIEKYLGGLEVAPAPALDDERHPIALQNATVTWSQARSMLSVSAPLVAATPHRRFVLVDLSISFPTGKLSLVCGKLGSGKTLLLLSLLGEADILAGQIRCPRSPPDTIASFAGVAVPPEKWIISGVCAYVPQSTWLQNATIRENILFNLPYVEERYMKTLEVCALVSDLKILEDGDQSEIGERGINLSGGQKARVSLARAVYSRASILLFDDVLSAVDAHTAHHLYHECLKGSLMNGRTIILVSHHVQLCAPGASYIVALDNGRVTFSGNCDEFKASGMISSLVHADIADTGQKEENQQLLVEEIPIKPSSLSALTEEAEAKAGTSSTPPSDSLSKGKGKKISPRKLIEEEKRAVGRISKEIWKAYIEACGGWVYWALFIFSMLLATLSPVIETYWVRLWSGDSQLGKDTKGPVYYITIYTGLTSIGLIIASVRWAILYLGSIHASTVLYKRLLEAVLFAQIRFHDTVSRGRLLNRFGKDFEGIDSSLSTNFGGSAIGAFGACTTLITLSVVGGLPFAAVALIIGFLYYNVAKVYGQCSRDLRRLDSVTRSPLYSIYGETISGVIVLRAFGASSKILRDMLQCVDTNSNPYYWTFGVNRWLSARLNLLSSAVVGVTGVVVLITPRIDPSMAGFALAFSVTIANDVMSLVRRFVNLEQSMVAMERVREFSELAREAPEFTEFRPPPSWPSKGSIVCQDLVIRYSPELPNVLHNLNFTINPGERVGILGRTGSGKSTLALSFFRFVEATEGRILVDGLDIAKIGLTDLRSKLTIIPQDPTILSGTVRSTLDVFDEFEDTEIFDALRRVHLIPSDGSVEDTGESEETNANIFRNLDAAVSESGENFSTGEKQLLCIARAILKRTKVLVMDEATASVDYATDELIGKTIRHQFANCTVLTIAHRLRTVIDYNRVMLLDEGRIIEFDQPAKLLSDTSSKFYSLCEATGKEEFAVLKRMASV